MIITKDHDACDVRVLLKNDDGTETEIVGCLPQAEKISVNEAEYSRGYADATRDVVALLLDKSLTRKDIRRICQKTLDA